MESPGCSCELDTECALCTAGHVASPGSRCPAGDNPAAAGSDRRQVRAGLLCNCGLSSNPMALIASDCGQMRCSPRVGAAEWLVRTPRRAGRRVSMPAPATVRSARSNGGRPAPARRTAGGHTIGPARLRWRTRPSLGAGRRQRIGSRRGPAAGGGGSSWLGTHGSARSMARSRRIWTSPRKVTAPPLIPKRHCPRPGWSEGIP